MVIIRQNRVTGGFFFLTDHFSLFSWLFFFQPLYPPPLYPTSSHSRADNVFRSAHRLINQTNSLLRIIKTAVSS